MLVVSCAMLFIPYLKKAGRLIDFMEHRPALELVVSQVVKAFPAFYET
jgi:hypothetical protein